MMITGCDVERARMSNIDNTIFNYKQRKSDTGLDALIF